MSISLFQVDAFTHKVFRGNPAAVCPLEDWLPDQVMQEIAAENNLSETAFFVPVPKESAFRIRWFTPTAEVDLCGHATLAAAHVIYRHLSYPSNEILFFSNSGQLFVYRNQVDNTLTLDLPAQPTQPTDSSVQIMEAMGKEPIEVRKGEDLLLRYRKESDIRALSPDFRKLSELPVRGVIATAPGDTADFVCRFFAPAVGVDEDPVTGSAFTKLVPYWAKELKKRKFRAWQLSSRSGELFCELRTGRVQITGQAVTFMQGQIFTQNI